MISGAGRLLLRRVPPQRGSSHALRCAVARCAALPRTRRAAAMTAAAASSSPPAAAASPAAEGEEGPPLFSFGVLTDVQYAPIPDGASFGGTPRYYRHALEALRCAPRRAPRRLRSAAALVLLQWLDATRRRARSEAVTDWRTRDLSCALHLGDILDGFCPKARCVAAALRAQRVNAAAHTCPPLAHAGLERGGAAQRAGRV
jgi:hypothetical protein